MIAHWAMNYLGKPWVSGASGPDSFNCWGLVRAVQWDRYGRNVPLICADESNQAEIIAAFTGNPEYANWQQVDMPAEGDCVITMSAPDSPEHVGIYLDIDGGRILQCVFGAGVVAPSLRATQRVIGQHLQFWRHKD